MNNQSGFTLLEALVVLAIIGVCLLSIPFYKTQQISEHFETQLLFTHIKSDINNAQLVAITEQQSTQVVFDSEEHTIAVYALQTGDMLTYIELPEQWQLRTNWTIQYLPTGRANRFGTVVLEHVPTTTEYRIIFQLGSGRFEIK